MLFFFFHENSLSSSPSVVNTHRSCCPHFLFAVGRISIKISVKRLSCSSEVIRFIFLSSDVKESGFMHMSFFLFDKSKGFSYNQLVSRRLSFVPLTCQEICNWRFLRCRLWPYCIACRLHNVYNTARYSHQYHTMSPEFLKSDSWVMGVEVIDSLLMRTDQVDQSQRKLDNRYENLTFSTYTEVATQTTVTKDTYLHVTLRR